MQSLNYHHLLYFWTVAREGSIARASEKLKLAQPTISGQIHELEDSLGEPLFTRQGRGLALTDTGRTVLQYAERIFALGGEMVSIVKGSPAAKVQMFRVGVSPTIPALLVQKLLEPIVKLKDTIQLSVQRSSLDALTAALSANSLDIIVSDTAIPRSTKLFAHHLGKSTLSVFADVSAAPTLRRKFPSSLNSKSMVLLNHRQEIAHWMDNHAVRPTIIAEISDLSLAMPIAQTAHAAITAPTVLEHEIQRISDMRAVGRMEIVQGFVAFTRQRNPESPAFAALLKAAHQIF